MKYNFVSTVVDYLKKQNNTTNNKNELISDDFLASTEVLLNMINDSLFPEFSGLKLSSDTNFLDYNPSIDINGNNDVNISLKNINDQSFNIHINTDGLSLIDDSNSLSIIIFGGSLDTRGISDHATKMFLSLECGDDIVCVEKRTEDKGEIFLTLYLDANKYRTKWSKLTDLVPEFTYIIKKCCDSDYKLYYKSTPFSENFRTNRVTLFDLREYAVLFVNYCHKQLEKIDFKSKGRTM